MPTGNGRRFEDLLVASVNVVSARVLLSDDQADLCDPTSLDIVIPLLQHGWPGFFL